jgi:hypothetical protein
MSYKRYHIRAGATTTAGGTVKASMELFKLNGAPTDATQDGAASRTGANTAANCRGAARIALLVPLRFVDRISGKPYANRPYRLELMDGTVVRGTTDSNGRTRPLTSEERNGLKVW